MRIGFKKLFANKRPKKIFTKSQAAIKVQHIVRIIVAAVAIVLQNEFMSGCHFETAGFSESIQFYFTTFLYQ